MATDGVEGKGVPKTAARSWRSSPLRLPSPIENAKLYKNSRKMEELKRSQALLSRAEKFSFLGNLAARLATK